MQILKYDKPKKANGKSVSTVILLNKTEHRIIQEVLDDSVRYSKHRELTPKGKTVVKHLTNLATLMKK